MTVTEMNAYRLNDTYQIINNSIDTCVGLEHNPTEAKKIAQWLTHENGIKHSVRRNNPDIIRAAIKIRKDVLRVKNRDQILIEMEHINVK